jgi:hypothetical protein
MAIIFIIGELYYIHANLLFSITITLGLITSIWNHSTTSIVAKISDRLMMYIGFLLVLYTIMNCCGDKCTIPFVLLCNSGLMYLLAKLFIKCNNIKYNIHIANCFHVLSHCSHTYSILLIMENMNN